jgi:hypothetical protein
MTYDRRQAALNLTYPTIHLNGTGRERLLDTYRQMGNALRMAINVIEQNGPHGRDYYIQGADAIRKAQQEHKVRLEKLESVLSELKAIAINISEQGR